MKFFKVFISLVFVLFIKTNTIPILVWKGENPITKKSVLVMGDAHLDMTKEYIERNKFEQTECLPKLIQFINELSLSTKESNLLFETQKRREFDLRYGCDVNCAKSNLKGSISLITNLQSNFSKLGNLNFVSADVRPYIGILFYRMFMSNHYVDDLSVCEKFLIQVSLSDFIKNMKEMKDQVEKELLSLKISQKGKDYLKSLMSSFDKAIKNFEENEFVKYFFNCFPDGKDKMTIFIRLLELHKSPEKIEELTKSKNNTDKLIIKFFDENKIKLEDFFKAIAGMKFDMNEFEKFHNVIFADLGFILDTIQSLDSGKDTIVFCGAAHAAQVINFLSKYEGYVTKFQSGDTRSLASSTIDSVKFYNYFIEKPFEWFFLFFSSFDYYITAEKLENNEYFTQPLSKELLILPKELISQIPEMLKSEAEKISLNPSLKVVQAKMKLPKKSPKKESEELKIEKDSAGKIEILDLDSSRDYNFIQKVYKEASKFLCTNYEEERSVIEEMCTNKTMMGTPIEYKILFVNGEHVGIINYIQLSEDQGYIMSLYVDPKHRRKGYAQMLVNYAIEDLFSDEAVNAIDLSVNCEEGLKLFKKLGFEVTSINENGFTNLRKERPKTKEDKAIIITPVVKEESKEESK